MKNKLAVLFMVLGLLVGVAAPLAVSANAGTTNAGTTTTGCPTFGTVVGTGGTITGGSDWDFKSVICRIQGILSALIPLMMVLGLLYFIYGVITYVIAGDEEAKTAGRDRIIYGVIGFTAIITVWGLVAIVANTFGLNSAVKVTFPTIQTN